MFDAGLGRTTGASVNIVTKSGTNDFHGTLFEYLRNAAFNANTFLNNETGTPRGELTQNQFGGTFGGPIKKDKLFFFFSYQGTRQYNAVSRTRKCNTVSAWAVDQCKDGSRSRRRVLPRQQSRLSGGRQHKHVQYCLHTQSGVRSGGLRRIQHQSRRSRPPELQVSEWPISRFQRHSRS